MNEAGFDAVFVECDLSSRKSILNLIEEAQKDAQKILGEARAKLTAEAEASLVELRSKVGNLSQQLVARVLNG